MNDNTPEFERCKRNIESVWSILRSEIPAHKYHHNYSFRIFQRDIENKFINVSNRNIEFLIDLFWCSWICQVMNYLLINRFSKNRRKDFELFKQFKKKFNFPFVEADLRHGAMKPIDIISSVIEYNGQKLRLGTKAIFLEKKIIFWEPVKDWLLEIEREDILEAAFSEFEADITDLEMLPKDFYFTFEHDSKLLEIALGNYFNATKYVTDLQFTKFYKVLEESILTFPDIPLKEERLITILNKYFPNNNYEGIL